MRIVINHPRVVIPEQEKRIFDVVQNAAGQFQRRPGLKILLSWPGNLGFGYRHVELDEERDAWMGGDSALVKACVAKLHELDAELPVLRRAKRTSERRENLFESTNGSFHLIAH
jgi:hypothetical protein